ncbi:peptidoglycan bridge formation glycyltransferase FemA/FemB family protein [Flavihumibacter rivuli]|uniref:peptidoglycan bridge formation glycyltransferase FemA/FemB family protein n=1 Tax=Flavihumibacter rivuli TaxID=2838156 RepID=UPI001BDE4ABC|nr:peptidoglycan bridge formation glycyltransferase FemA/FemB family protein [Flavihumibacter rivuli]ULQ57949.1 peptidoglycan bridge formation glycyltransferase FemA/FemB family protein [Flavihumibacter rivuli]
MIKYRMNYSGIGVGVSWYIARQGFLDSFLPNVYYHVKNTGGKELKGVEDISHTLEIDLRQPVETLHGSFQKSYRQQIRQSEEEGITCYFSDDIPFFVDFFNQFAKVKNIHTVTVERMMEMKPFLKLSFAEYQGTVLAVHSYLVDEDTKIVRTFHSATRRLEDNIERNRVGKANKYLHYKDMIAFKEMGIETYDFGGIAKDTEQKDLKGINEFKMGFGGEVVPCRNVYSYGYYLMRKVSRMLGLTGKVE